MSKKGRLSRDQKRKAKLAKRNCNATPVFATPYAGDRFKSPKFVSPLFETEQGIYTAYVCSLRKLADVDVKRSLERLISDLRSRPVTELLNRSQDAAEQDPQGIIEQFICLHWRDLANRGGLPPRDDLIGILRTLLGSVENWSTRSLESRGYLHFLEGFLTKRMGVRVELIDSNDEPRDDVSGNPVVDELLELGRAWLSNGDRDEAADFRMLVEDCMDTGNFADVVNACQTLIGEYTGSHKPEMDVLMRLSLKAHEAQADVESGSFVSGPERRAPGIRSFLSRLIGR